SRAQRIAQLGIWRLDCATGKLQWSDEIYHIMGHDKDSFEPDLEKYFAQAHQDDVPVLQLELQKTYETSSPRTLDHRFVLEDGSIRIAHLQSEPMVYAEDGSPLYLEGTLQDVTERVTEERERLTLQRQLQQSQKMQAIGQLTGGIAHDFNNILANIMGYTELLQSNGEINKQPKVSQYLNEVYTSGKRARDLIAQMLSFSRGDESSKKSVDIGMVVSDGLRLVGPAIPSTIRLQVDIEKYRYTVLADPIKLQQLVLNLAINARDAMNNVGELSIKVHRQASTSWRCTSCHESFSGEYAAISVKDNGSGIDADNLERIFDPFFSTKEPGAGTGMGLSVVHGIVHELNGHIVVDSHPGKGSEFTILLPLLEQSTELDFEPSSDAISPEEYRVMLVDDEPGALGLMKEQLDSLGYDVVAYTHPQEALIAFNNNSAIADILVVDCTMPDLNGVELAHKVQGIKPDLPVIICCESEENNISDTKAEFGLLHKPVDMRALINEMQAQLKAR
ncbi:MAG: response regulator, partial [Gammaproteobacteria bacterium]|nr:response regulator [Gammaproteobacteria bacterium]